MNPDLPATGRRTGLPLPGLSAAFVGSVMLACLAFLLIAGPAQAKDGQVTVRAAGTTNASVTVKLSDLGSNDINNRVYRLKSGSVTISGYSLLKVMRAADEELDEINLATIPAIEIDRPSGNPIRISGDDMRNPAAFSDGPPVFYEDNGATVFVMPGKGAATGNRYRFVGAPVGISVSSGADYEIDLNASKTKVKVGQKVSFSAFVSGQASGESLSYRWQFGDGTVRTTSRGSVSHSFRKAGAFPVILGVSGDSGAGQSGILIEVGEVKKPKPKPKPKPDEDQNPEPPSSEGNGGTGGFGGGYGGYGGGFGGGTGSSGSGTGGGAPMSPSLPRPAAPKDPEPDRPVTLDDGLVEVEGQLVDPDATTVVLPADSDAVESADPASPGTEQGGFGIPGTAWTLMGVGLLMGLGMFAELRLFSRLY